MLYFPYSLSPLISNIKHLQTPSSETDIICEVHIVNQFMHLFPHFTTNAKYQIKSREKSFDVSSIDVWNDLQEMCNSPEPSYAANLSGNPFQSHSMHFKLHCIAQWHRHFTRIVLKCLLASLQRYCCLRPWQLCTSPWLLSSVALLNFDSKSDFWDLTDLM